MAKDKIFTNLQKQKGMRTCEIRVIELII